MMSESKQQSQIEAATLQQQTIDKEIQAQSATGNIENPSILLQEYKDNPSFLPKIQQLCVKYTGIRRSRGDGNCFYRSVAFQVLNYLRQKPTVEEVELHLLQHKAVLDGLLTWGYESFAIEDFYEQFVDNARELHGKSIATLEALFQTQVELYLVSWVRLITSFAIQSKAETFLPFIIALGHNDAKTFCQSQVEPAKVDADQLPIQALAEFMHWFTVVEYLDQSEGPLNCHEFGTKGTNEAASSHPTILVLYRPGKWVGGGGWFKFVVVFCLWLFLSGN